MGIRTKIPASIIWGLIIVSSAFYARPFYNLIISIIPRFYIAIAVGSILLLVLSFVSFYATKLLKANFKNNALVILQIILSFAALFCLFINLDLPEEKIHLLLYASLGALRSIEIRGKNKIIKSTAFVFLFSLASECLQGLTPGRYYDNRDIGIDTISGIAGTLLANVFLTCKCSRKENRQC